MNEQTIGSRIKSERQRLGVTQPRLGEITGAVKTTVIDWENGVSSPKATQLAKMCDAGFDPAFVLTGVRSAAFLGQREEDRQAAEHALDIVYQLPDDDRQFWLSQGDALVHRAVQRNTAVGVRRPAAALSPHAINEAPARYAGKSAKRNR